MAQKIKHSSAKAKGRNLQKWVANKISEVLGIKTSREDNSLIASRDMGQSGTDVILRGEALERFPYAIECKSTETWSIPKTIRQARANVGKEHASWLIFMKKKEFSAPVVVMDANEFFNLYSGALSDAES